MSRPPIVPPPDALVCFAVKQEAAVFTRSPVCSDKVRVLLTGMGLRNARDKIADALNQGSVPSLVISSGFAGGLKPGLARGTVVFEAGERFKWEAALKNAGAVPGAFHCASRVAATAAEKAALRRRTGADAVDMESLSIQEVCRRRRIPSVTVRVILDTAEEDLPLDFNTLLSPDEEVDPARLAWALAKAPGKIPALMRLGRHAKDCAHRLAEVLERFLRPH